MKVNQKQKFEQAVITWFNIRGYSILIHLSVEGFDLRSNLVDQIKVIKGTVFWSTWGEPHVMAHARKLSFDPVKRQILSRNKFSIRLKVDQN